MIAQNDLARLPAQRRKLTEMVAMLRDVEIKLAFRDDKPILKIEKKPTMILFVKKYSNRYVTLVEQQTPYSVFYFFTVLWLYFVFHVTVGKVHSCFRHRKI